MRYWTRALTSALAALLLGAAPTAQATLFKGGFTARVHPPGPGTGGEWITALGHFEFDTDGGWGPAQTTPSGTYFYRFAPSRAEPKPFSMSIELGGRRIGTDGYGLYGVAMSRDGEGDHLSIWEAFAHGSGAGLYLNGAAGALFSDFTLDGIHMQALDASRSFAATNAFYPYVVRPFDSLALERVPEPGSLALALAGLVAISVRRRAAG